MIEKPLQVFCCYAREDRPLLRQLKNHLKPLENTGLIVVQTDIDVSPGEVWEQKISQYLNTAQIILLLVSPDFVGSEYCYSKEMKRAMERYECGETHVIPIILRPALWDSTLFSKLQALPTDGKPVTSNFWYTSDDAFLDVAGGIRDVAITVRDDIKKLKNLLQTRKIALFGYETQDGNNSVLWSNPDTFSLNKTYLEWSETKRDFTERELVDHIWIKAGNSGNLSTFRFLPQGLLYESPFLDSTEQLQGSWKLINGVLRTNIEQYEGDTLVKYELDIFANRNNSIHSGIESNNVQTTHSYFVLLPSQQATKRLEEALAAYNQLLCVNQNCVEVYKTKGNILRDLGRYEEALGAYQRAIELKPGYMWAWYDKGDMLHKLKRYEEAIAAFDRAIELDGQNAWAWFEKGQTFYDLERYKEALPLYERAIEIDPNHAWFWHQKGETLHELEQYTEALTSYEQALKVDPNFAKSYNGKGNVLYRSNLKQYTEAIAAYQQAIKLQPDYMWAWHNMGNVLHELGRFEEALVAYKRTTELDPGYFWAWYNMGNVLHELGRFEEALDALIQAIERNEDKAVAWREKGKTFQDLERYEEALVSYERALKLEPQWTSIWTRKGQVLHKLKRYEEAITAYDEALKYEANYVDAHLGRGRVYLDLKDHESALRTYEQAISVAPNNTWAWHDKGQTLGHLQRAEEALEAFERAIELDPENKWAWFHKAETLTYLARHAYKKAGQPGGEPLKREYYNLVHKATGKYLDGNGSVVYMHAPNGGRFQLWKATEVAPNIIILKHFQSGKVLEATVERGAYLNEYNGSLSQQWIPEDGDHGYQKLKQVATGMVLLGDINNDVYLQPDEGNLQIWMAAKIQITSFIAPHSSPNTAELLVFEQ